MIPCACCEAKIDLALSYIKAIQKALSSTPVPPTKMPIPRIIATPFPGVATVPTRVSAPLITTAPIINNVNTGIKEFYITFGSGNSAAEDWSDVSGLQASIDTSLYPAIKNSIIRGRRTYSDG